MAVRVKAFLFEALALVATGIFAVLMSPEFSSLVTSHWGSSFTTSLILLSVSGAVKHLSNLSAIKKAESLGAAESPSLYEDITLI